MLKDGTEEARRYQFWIIDRAVYNKQVIMGERKKCFSCHGTIGQSGVQDFLSRPNRDYCLKCAKLFGIWE